MKGASTFSGKSFLVNERAESELTPSIILFHDLKIKFLQARKISRLGMGVVYGVTAEEENFPSKTGYKEELSMLTD